ncbi:uncharacterized protein PV07_06734 [Cladophialophora immunda]|uniref:Uncharacterized protein n=1 Tax=Cladophialophora immunda TaxID=569365 RepID=A0A0D2APD3_9EURO|nr:uncharacterized protein PV07_06734 [Cladophialophora immunda]KIW26947.1 hypothetical protein PV07_06734 [Cladophialophora immunda]
MPKSNTHTSGGDLGFLNCTLWNFFCQNMVNSKFPCGLGLESTSLVPSCVAPEPFRGRGTFMDVCKERRCPPAKVSGGGQTRRWKDKMSSVTKHVVGQRQLEPRGAQHQQPDLREHEH